MKLVQLNKSYLEFLRKKNSKYHQTGIGLSLYLNNKHLFIPITSKKRKIQDKKDKNKFMAIGKYGKNGTLLIIDYIYILPHLVKPLLETDTIRSEFLFFSHNKKELEKKIKFQINFSKNFSDKNKKMYLEEYTKYFLEKNKYYALKYTEEVIKSMAIIEKIKFSEDEIDNIIKYKVFEKIDLYDTETIFNLRAAWEFMRRTLYTPIKIDYIIHINEIIAHHQALKVGDIRDQINSVSGEFIIEVPNKGIIIRYLNYILSESENIREEALKLFLTIILNQWFFDGNKRTAFLIANKILISSGFGILLINKSNEEQFTRLLYYCYKNRNQNSKNELLKYLSENCIIEFSKKE